MCNRRFLLMAIPHVLGVVLPVEASTGFQLDLLGGRAVVPFPNLVVGLTITLRKNDMEKDCCNTNFEPKKLNFFTRNKSMCIQFENFWQEKKDGWSHLLLGD